MRNGRGFQERAAHCPSWRVWSMSALMTPQVLFLPFIQLNSDIQAVLVKPLARHSPCASRLLPVLVLQSYWSQDGGLPERSNLRPQPEGREVNQRVTLWLITGDRESVTDRGNGAAEAPEMREWRVLEEQKEVRGCQTETSTAGERVSPSRGRGMAGMMTQE